MRKIFLWIIVTLAAAGCSNDLKPIINREDGDGIEFSAMLKKDATVLSRASGPDTNYITVDTFDCNFYIRMQTGVKDTIGTYSVQSGYEGRLATVEGNVPLNWQSLTDQHIFYGWTVPWKENYTPSSNDTITVNFLNSSEEDGYAQNGNNQIMEKFIGAVAGPYSYSEHGKYVDFTFRHLVSKIKIGTFQLIEASGAIQRNLKANVTFINMPTTATLYTCPIDENSNPIAPYVEPGEQNPNNGITYFISNEAVGSDYFYVCPEVDFSTLEFKVDITSATNPGFDTYYGNFADVEFVRVAGTAFDAVEGNDSTILHAGEMMVLNITLIPGVGPGIALIIDNWSTQEPNESQYHTYPGIYSDAELSEILNTFINQTVYQNGVVNPETQSLWEMYGETGPNGEKYFPLYDNVVTSSNIFPIPQGFMLNGNGHTVSMKTNTGVFGSDPYYNIGPARDVYLTDPNGNNMIYIDPNGYIWVNDPDTGNLKNSGNQLQALVYPQKSYDIDCITGTIRYSEYYNNNFPG